MLRGRPSLRTGLWALAVAAPLAVFALAMQPLFFARTHALRDAARETSALDMVMAEQTGRAVETVDIILTDATETVRAMQGGPALAVDEILAGRVGGLRQLTAVDFTDRSGKVVYSSRIGPLGAVPEDAMPLLAALAADPHGAASAISGPMRGIDGKWVALLARPLTDGGDRLTGMAIAYINLQYFEDFYRAVQLGEGSVIELMRTNGAVLARHPRDDDAIGRRSADDQAIARALAGGRSGTARMTSADDGSARIISAFALRSYPLTIAVSVDVGQVLGPWREEAAIVAAAAVVAAFILGVGLHAAARLADRTKLAAAGMADVRP